MRSMLIVALVVWPTVGFAENVGNAKMAHDMMDHTLHSGEMPSETGQSAFAAIQEIVGLLDADPKTDWSKVNVDALRAHLVDMDAVTLHATVVTESVDGGLKFAVSGDEKVKSSITRMVLAHAKVMNGINGWQLSALETSSGATLTVTVPASDFDKLKALGFFGVLAIGMHHNVHHLMIARGANPH